MNLRQKIKIVRNGLIATLSLLVLYFTIVTLVSGFTFAISQFESFWYFLISLAIGFGIQIGLYSYLTQVVKQNNMAMNDATVAVTGTTSTLTMISCCAHYLATILPILGIAGVLTIVAQYQNEIFWIGLAFNAFGILFISTRIIMFNKHL